MKKLLCGGISTCDVYVTGATRMPAPNEAAEVDNIFFQIGGGAANAMIDFCKIGGSCTLCVRIGRDYAGRVVLESLKEYEAQMDVVVKYDEGSTAVTIALTGNRDRSFLASLGTTLKFRAEDIPLEKVKEADIVFVSGTCLMHSFDCPALAGFLKTCKELGKITVLDTAPDLRGIWLPTIEGALPYIDYFIPSQSEAEALTGLTEPDAMIDFFVQRGSSTVILKMGAQGVYLRKSDGSRKWIAGFRTEVVDTTGAGDSFCAGFCYGLVNDYPIERAIRFGNAVGAFCVSAMGASAGIPPAAEIDAFLASHT